MAKRKLYRCRHCNHETSERVDKWQHIKTHVTPDKLLTCNSCPFVTEYKHHLEYHQRNHNNYKPFKCDQCDYQCVNRSMLKSHSKSHSSDCPYQCGQCKYATKYAHSLKMHIKKYCHQQQQPASERPLLHIDTSVRSSPQLCCKKENDQPPDRHSNDGGRCIRAGHNDHGATSTSPASSSATTTSTCLSTPISATTPTSLTPLTATTPTSDLCLEPQLDILDLRISSKLRVKIE